MAKRPNSAVPGASKKRKTNDSKAPILRKPLKQTKLAPLFSNDENILLIGEGNFSYTRCLIHENLVDAEKVTTTCLDRQNGLFEKYDEAKDIVEELQECACTVLFGIDGTQMHKTKSIKKRAPYDVIIFNFPHVGSGMKDQDRNILENQKMLVGFFNAARHVLAPHGKILISLFQNERYEKWGLKGLAKSLEYRVHSSRPFEWKKGYSHRRTAGHGGFESSRQSTLYAFERNHGERFDESRRDESDQD